MHRQRTARVIAFLSAAAVTYGMRRVDPDLYGYLTYGRLFVEQGRIVERDPFAYTSAGSTWVAFEWLSQLLLWLAYDAAGPLGLIALKCGIGAIALYFLYRAIREVTDEPGVWLPVFLFTGAAVSRYFLFRPQVFTFALFAVFVTSLIRWMSGRRSFVWALPALMVVWANLHGGFLAGLGAIGLAILLTAGQRLRSGSSIGRALASPRVLWGVLAASGLATLLTPNGLKLWRYVLTELLHPSNRRYVAEWRPAHQSGDIWSLVALTATAFLLVTLAWPLRRERRPSSGPASLDLFLSSVPLVLMAYLSIRHTPLALIWSAPVLAVLLARRREEAASSLQVRTASFCLAALGSLSVLLIVAYVVAHPRPVIAADGPVLGPEHPCGAVSFIHEHELKGNVHTPLRWGAYLTWELYPAVRVSMDGRNISLFPREMVLENLIFYWPGTPAPDLDVPLKYETDFLLVPSSFPALAALGADPRWQQVYRDEDAVLFVRADRRHALLPGDIGETSRSRCVAALE